MLKSYFQNLFAKIQTGAMLLAGDFWLQGLFILLIRLLAILGRKFELENIKRLFLKSKNAFLIF